MKTFFLRYQKMHIWLLTALAAIALFHLLKGSRAVMNGLTEWITQPLKTLLGTVCSVVPFSVAEGLIFASVGILVLYMVSFAAALVRGRGERKRIFYRRTLGLLCAMLSVYALFCILWGANYYTDDFEHRSGIYAKSVSVEQLTDVTRLFVERLNGLAHEVPRSEEGVFNVPRDEIYAAAPDIYDTVEERYPFLEMRDHVPKRIMSSKFMSETNFTGFFFPFTGEANLNDHSPACLLPSTIAHELAHQRGIASEQECNFLAVLVCETSGDAAYEYSGALFGFIHLSNALYRADRQAWEALHEELTMEVRMDLHYNNLYWDQFESATGDISHEVYDRFLKGYGEESGIQSYGEVVDLLVAYYGEK